MPKQLGPVHFSGRLDDLVGYSLHGNHYVKFVGGPSRDKWRTSKKMRRARQNAFVFGALSKMVSHIYTQVPDAIRRRCGPYPHNKLLAQLRAGANPLGYVPDVLPAGLAASLVGMDLGACRKPKAGTDAIAGAQVQVQYAPEQNTLRIANLSRAAAAITLKPKERLEFRIHVAQIEAVGMALTRDRKTYLPQPGVTNKSGRAVLPHATTPWIPAQAVTGNPSPIDERHEPSHAQSPTQDEPITLSTGPLAHPDCPAVLLLVTVEWRATHGERVRFIHDAATVRIAHCQVAETHKLPHTTPIRKPRHRRYTLKRRSANIPPATRLRTAIRRLEKHLNKPLPTPLRE